MDIEQFRKAGYAAIDQICDYYTTLNERKVKAEVEPGYLIKQLPTSPPTQGQPFPEIAADFHSKILPGITHWQHGKFFGYFPAVVTFESILGDLYSSSVTNPGFNWTCSPACTELEQVVMDWMARVLGLSEEFLTSSGSGGGTIGNSASEVALTATIAARERALRHLARHVAATTPDDGTVTPSHDIAPMDVPPAVRDEYTPKLVMYGSSQTHSLGSKAGVILGLPFRALPVRAEDGYALRGDTLRKAVEEDMAKGLVPFMVIGTVGTTSSGAVDYIAELGEVVRAHPTMFMHVDAAWAGVAYALPEQRAVLRLDEVNRYADSFCTNAHKWGMVGFDCSLFFVRDRRDLTDALDVTPAYLRTTQADSGAVIDYRNWQLSLGRRFRSIKLWFVLRSYGVEGLQAHLRRGVEFAQQLASVIDESDEFEQATKPSLGLVTFVMKGESLEVRNDRTKKLHSLLDANPETMITSTILQNEAGEKVTCLRFAIGARTTTAQDVMEVWQVVVAEGNKVLGAE